MQNLLLEVGKSEKNIFGGPISCASPFRVRTPRSATVLKGFPEGHKDLPESAQQLPADGPTAQASLPSLVTLEAARRTGLAAGAAGGAEPLDHGQLVHRATQHKGRPRLNLPLPANTARGAEARSRGAESRPARGPSPAVEDGLLPGAQPVCLSCHSVRKLHELAAGGRLAQQQDRGVHAGAGERSRLTAAPVCPGCHPSRCCLGEHPLHAAHPTRLRDEPEQGSWSRAPRAELRLGAATAPLGGLPRRSPGPSRSDQTLGPSSGLGPSIPPAWRERTPVCPKNPPSPRTGIVLHNSHPPGPQVPRTPPASSKPHGPVLPTRPPWAPPALLGGEALHTPPTPQAGPSHAYSHHPHAGRDVQRVDGDAVEEARDCTSWRETQEWELAGRGYPGRRLKTAREALPTQPQVLLTAPRHLPSERWPQRGQHTAPWTTRTAQAGEALAQTPRPGRSRIPELACSRAQQGHPALSPFRAWGSLPSEPQLS